MPIRNLVAMLNGYNKIILTLINVFLQGAYSEPCWAPTIIHGVFGWALRPWFSCEVAHREGGSIAISQIYVSDVKRFTWDFTKIS